MKKAFLLSMLSLFLLAGTAHAVTLQQGWWVRYEYVSLYGHEGPESAPITSWGTGWYPTSTLGLYGPIRVEEGAYPFTRGRTVTIVQTTNAEPGVFFEDYGSYTSAGPYYQDISLTWQTDYDASRLQLQVFRHKSGQADELVWQQTASGYTVPPLGQYDIWHGAPLLDGEQVVVRLVVVPEPSGLLVLGGALPSFAWLMRRAAKRG